MSKTTKEDILIVALHLFARDGYEAVSVSQIAGELGIRYHGLPEGEDASFFLCEELMPGYLNGITGEYAPPAGYLVNEKEAEAFDREFPYMEKKKLPGQIFEGDIR